MTSVQKKNLPYWLIRERGKDHGFGTVDLDTAITSDAAIESWKNSNQEWVGFFGPGFDWDGVTATLVVLSYDKNGDPHVTDVK